MNKEINDKLREMGISIESRFVPTKYDKVKDARLNWYVTLVVNGKPILSTNYMAGIGRIVGYKQRWGSSVSVDEAHAILAVCNEGQPRRTSGPPFNYSRPDIDTAGVVYALQSDADAIEYQDFEDWASNFGCNADSRKGKKMYRACLDIGLKMRHALGDGRLAALHELFQDYEEHNT